MLSYFKKDLEKLRGKYALFAFRDCTEEEISKIEKYKNEFNQIPNDVMVVEPLEEGNKETIYRRQTKDLDSTHEERIEYIMLMQTEHMSAIRKMLLFFVILTCIGIAAGLIAVIASAA